MNGDPNSITIPTPVTNGTMPPAPASDAAMIGQDVANKYPNNPPAGLANAGTPPTPTLATPTTPNTPAAASTPTRTPAPQTRGEWFNHILKAVTPPQNVIRTNPDGTQSTTDARTNPSMTKMLMASVMAGILSPTKYREGAYGPVVDGSATAAAAGQAGAAKGREMSQAAQKQYDDMQSRKLNAVAANTQAMHSYASMMGAQAAARKEGVEAEDAQTKNWNDIVDQNTAGILSAADEYDAHRTTGSPSARYTSHMTTEELLASPFKTKMTSQLMVQDGIRNEFDPKTGQTHSVPTWTLLNPDVDVKVNQSTIDRLSKINPSLAKAWENSGGNLQLNLGRLTTFNHQATSVEHAADLFSNIENSKDKDLQALGLHKGDVDSQLASAVKSDPSAWKALADFENASAHPGQDMSQTARNGLNRLLNSAGGPAIFKALGTDADAVKAYINKYDQRIVKQNAIAKAGGNPAKLPATQEQISSVAATLVPNDYLTSDDATSLTAQMPKPDEDGNIEMTQAQISSIEKQRDALIEKAKAAQVNAGNPQEIASQVNLTLGSGDLTGVKDLFPGNRSVPARLAFNKASAQLASSIGLNPTHYTIESMKEKAAKDESYKDTSRPNAVGSSINAYQTFLAHNADAVDASNNWHRTNEEFWNMPLNKLEKKFGNDPSFIKFKASLEPPSKEFMSFLNAGRAEHAADGAAMAQILDENSSPSRINAALQQLARSADDRAAVLGDQYVGVVGTTYPRLLNESSLSTLKMLGIDSKAAAFNGQLPRNPAFAANPSATTLAPISDRTVAKRFFAAAGNDPTRASEMAREHGWILNIK